MSNRSRVVGLGVAFLVCYLAVLAWHGPSRSPEAFPFFNWSLFSEVPDPEASDFSIRFTRVDGRDLETPVYFEDADFLATRSTPGAYQVLQQLGRALDRERTLQIATAQELLETKYLGQLGSADYEVVSRRFDIVERHQCDCFTSERALTELSMGP